MRFALYDLANAERSGASLSALLGRDASMQFHSLESAKSADLQAALPLPSSLAVVRLKPLPGFAFISVEANLLLTLLDGFFGGTGRATTDPQAPIRSWEQAMIPSDNLALADRTQEGWQRFESRLPVPMDVKETER